jgi:aminocarboxymuconate-semialdehyde decarboxylase
LRIAGMIGLATVAGRAEGYMGLFACIHSNGKYMPQKAPEHLSGSRRGRRAQVTVDFHCHTLTSEVENLVATRPQKLAERELQRRTQGAASSEYNSNTMLPAVATKLMSVETRLRDMDAMGVDIQVVSPSPSQYYYWADPDLSRELVRTQNEDIAAMCAKHPDRLRGLGNIALQHPDIAIEQLTHCIRELGFRGVEVSSMVNGIDLAAERFWPVWAKAQELRCLVFIHPLGTSLGERLNSAYLSNIIGQPLETTVALSHLIFGGVLDRYPGLRILAAHGGGYLPSYIGRSDHAWHSRPDARTMRCAPSEYLQRIWFDNLVYTPAGVRHLVSQVGATQVVLGTDYPFDMGSYDVHQLIESVPGLTEEEKDAVLGGNALRLLEGSQARP